MHIKGFPYTFICSYLSVPPLFNTLAGHEVYLSSKVSDLVPSHLLLMQHSSSLVSQLDAFHVASDSQALGGML